MRPPPYPPITLAALVIHCSVALPTPLQIRMQSTVGKGTGRGLLGTFIDILKLEGPKGLYRGVGPTCGRAASGAAVELAS
jgi:hypothetical protein